MDRPATEPTVDERVDEAPLYDEGLDEGPPYDERDLPREGRSIGPVPITLATILVAVAFIGSLIYLAWVVIAVDEEQIPLLAYGFVVLGACFAAIAVGALMGMWRAASRAAGGRALVLAIFGGVAGMAAIGCFTVAALSAMVWNT